MVNILRNSRLLMENKSVAVLKNGKLLMGSVYEARTFKSISTAMAFVRNLIRVSNKLTALDFEYIEAV